MVQRKRSQGVVRVDSPLFNGTCCDLRHFLFLPTDDRRCRLPRTIIDYKFVMKWICIFDVFLNSTSLGGGGIANSNIKTPPPPLFLVASSLHLYLPCFVLLGICIVRAATTRNCCCRPNSLSLLVPYLVCSPTAPSPLP